MKRKSKTRGRAKNVRIDAAPWWAIEIKKLRRDEGLITQATLAESLGVSPQLVSMWEKGSREPEAPAYLKLALRAKYPALMKFLKAAGINALDFRRTAASLYSEGSLRPEDTNSQIAVYDSEKSPHAAEPEGYIWVPKIWMSHPNQTICIHIRLNSEGDKKGVGRVSSLSVKFDRESYILVDRAEPLTYRLDGSRDRWAFWLGRTPETVLMSGNTSGEISEELLRMVWPWSEVPKGYEDLLIRGTGLCVGSLAQVWAPQRDKTLFLLGTVPIALVEEEPRPFQEVEGLAKSVSVVGKVIGIVEVAGDSIGDFRAVKTFEALNGKAASCFNEVDG